MTKQNKSKFIASVLIISILLPTVLLSSPLPTKAQSVPVSDLKSQTLLKSLTSTIASTATTATKETLSWGQKILEQSLKFIAKKLLAKMTQATINWINSGFHGSPLFLENPESFFRDIAKSQVKYLVDAIGYDSVRFPFGRQTALNVIDSYKLQFETNAQYSLSKVINDPDLLRRYRNDFNYGGWNGFLINTQYPQNNYLGFQMLVEQSLASRLEGTLQTPAQKVQTALQQGMGFLSPQTCPSNPAYNNLTNQFQRPSFKSKTVPYTWKPDPERTDEFNNARKKDYDDKYNSDTAQEKAKWAKENTCPGGLVATTPGAVVANQIFSATNTPFLQTALDGALGNSIAAIFDALLNKLIGDGLASLKTTSNPSAQPDNWSYNGYTLSGADTSDSVLNIPENVSVDVDEETSTNISGGNGSYIIQTRPAASIATARISGDTLTITGIRRGSTTVVISDTATLSPSRATVYITVSGAGDLKVIPANIRIGIDDTMTATISGGTPTYSITRRPDSNVAIADFADTILVISGVAKGSTSIELKDSSPQAETVTVLVEVMGPDDLSLRSDNISVEVNEPQNMTISGGTAPYFVEEIIDETVATAEILEGDIEITGIKTGQTLVTIRDSSVPARTVSVDVTVTDPNNLTGECVINGTIDTGVTQSDCQASGGIWSPSN